MELAFGHCPLTEEAHGCPLATLQLVGETQPDRHRKVTSDDGVAAIEANGFVEEVHRTTPTHAAAFDLAEHLGHDALGADALQQGMSVLPVRGDDRFVGLELAHDTGSDCFLADGEVEKAPDLHLAVQLGAALLHHADADHVAEEANTGLRGR